ncbi:MAG: hypothetical protein JWL79_2944 [Frankiales bacterium]|nr:hypothetical protein [Frankiales bacterium]
MSRYLANHFSLSNAVDDRPADLPHLLRRMADAIEAEGITSDQIVDVTVSSSIDDDVEGERWSMTVYWSDGAPE